jgi:hypothetical protein
LNDEMILALMEKFRRLTIYPEGGLKILFVKHPTGSLTSKTVLSPLWGKGKAENPARGGREAPDAASLPLYTPLHT